MAKVKFYAMDLDFEFIRKNFSPDLGTFILQPYMADADKWKDEFTLLIYALDIDGKVIITQRAEQKVDLKINKNFNFNAKNRLELGNIPFTKKQAEKFKVEDSTNKIKSLYFKPYLFGEYIAYKVTAKNENGETLASFEEDLKPSPPADPFAPASTDR